MAPYIDDLAARDVQDVNIIDIRSDEARKELKDDIKKGLDVADGTLKSLPTLLLYDERGLKLFEKITYLDEYYLTGEEIKVLEHYARDIAAKIPERAMLIELGSGNLRKIKLLLDALEQAGKAVDYFALDLDRKELQRTLSNITPLSFKHVRCFGLHGTYDDGLRWLNLPEQQSRPKVVLSLGSSIGNFSRDEAAEFLNGFLSSLAPTDSMIMGLDACQDSDKVHTAYNDPHGVTTDFTLNGLKHANTLLGYDAFDLAKWEHVGKYSQDNGQHEAFVMPKVDVQVLGISICKGELIKIEQSCKYSQLQTEQLWRAAGAVETAVWRNDTRDYGLHMIRRNNMIFASTPEQYAAHPVPSLEDWQALWQCWDIVTRQMIPDEELKAKPIKLRNACIFYLGHIPTFLDMKIVQGTGAEPTEPRYFHSIFERGIDPDVDNPEHCHAHSDIPDEWPPLDEILSYQEKVRARVTHMYTSGSAYNDLWTGRVLWLGLEHEAMHLETLLYMLLQSDKTVPPRIASRPDFEKLASEAEARRSPIAWVDILEQTITLGLDDADTRDGPLRHFGWDVEKPERKANVHSFSAANRPISNLDYAKYLVDTEVQSVPASWTRSASKVNSLEQFIAETSVRTVFGLVPLRLALDWPATASYDELAGCAAYLGGRIPTVEEARSIYNYADQRKQLYCSVSLQKTIPAVNGHLSNEGVQESPPAGHSTKTANGEVVPPASSVFVDLSSANVGFKHWTPTSVTGSADKLAGQAEMGGVWEWTSSPLEKQKGFVPMELYPAYSADFYDGKHNIVLGGSWATHPRLAGRKSFVNWYQRNYPYVWAGARIVKDIE